MEQNKMILNALIRIRAVMDVKLDELGSIVGLQHLKAPLNETVVLGELDECDTKPARQLLKAWREMEVLEGKDPEDLRDYLWEPQSEFNGKAPMDVLEGEKGVARFAQIMESRSQKVEGPGV